MKLFLKNSNTYTIKNISSKKKYIFIFLYN